MSMEHLHVKKVKAQFEVIHPERDSNQDTASPTLLNLLVAAAERQHSNTATLVHPSQDKTGVEYLTKLPGSPVWLV